MSKLRIALVAEGPTDYEVIQAALSALLVGALALQDAKPDGYTISQMHMGVLRQPLLVEDVQIQNNLLLTIGYTLIQQRPVAEASE